MSFRFVICNTEFHTNAIGYFILCHLEAFLWPFFTVCAIWTCFSVLFFLTMLAISRSSLLFLWSFVPLLEALCQWERLHAIWRGWVSFVRRFNPCFDNLTRIWLAQDIAFKFWMLMDNLYLHGIPFIWELFSEYIAPVRLSKTETLQKNCKFLKPCVFVVCKINAEHRHPQNRWKVHFWPLVLKEMLTKANTIFMSRSWKVLVSLKRTCDKQLLLPVWKCLYTATYFQDALLKF